MQWAQEDSRPANPKKKKGEGNEEVEVPLREKTTRKKRGVICSKAGGGKKRSPHHVVFVVPKDYGQKTDRQQRRRVPVLRMVKKGGSRGPAVTQGAGSERKEKKDVLEETRWGHRDEGKKNPLKSSGEEKGRNATKRFHGLKKKGVTVNSSSRGRSRGRKKKKSTRKKKTGRPKGNLPRDGKNEGS